MHIADTDRPDMIVHMDPVYFFQCECKLLPFAFMEDVLTSSVLFDIQRSAEERARGGSRGGGSTAAGVHGRGAAFRDEVWMDGDECVCARMHVYCTLFYTIHTHIVHIHNTYVLHALFRHIHVP